MELTIEQLLQQGIAAHKEGKLQDAERLYQAILQFQPQHPDANHNLGLIAVSVDQAAAALPLFKIAVEANPKIEQFWLAYIDALIKAQQFQTAKQVITEGEKNGLDAKKLIVLKAQIASIKKPENVNNADPSQLQLNTLVEHYQNERYVDAENLALSLTQQFPEHPLSWKVLAATFGQTGRNSEAIHVNQKVIALVPQDAEAYNNLGSTLKDLGRFEEAEASYTQAITLRPDYADAHYNLGNTLKELGKFDEADASYTQAIALKPDYVEAHNNLGIMLQEFGRLDEAEASYRQAITLKPDYVEAHNNLGNTLKELGRLDEAEASYRQAITLKPDFAEAHSNMGKTLQDLGRLEEAEASHTQAIALKPDYAEAHCKLGDTLQKIGRLEEAEVSYRQAIALTTGLFVAHENLAITQRELGRIEQAEQSERYEKFLNSPNVEANESAKFADNLSFSQPSPIEHPMLYRAGMGTENVGGFLRAMAQMLRPKNILEIGAGYTTPFLLEALINNERVYDDGNLEPSYFKNYVYDPKLVVIDNMSLGELSKKPGMNEIISSKYIDFIEGDFEGKAPRLNEKYGDFDFVWFDCGGSAEYKIFMDEYWDICSDYIFFHFTYSDGSPNDLHNIILNNVTGNPFIFDIVEPHKSRQGSITMVRKK